MEPGGQAAGSPHSPRGDPASPGPLSPQAPSWSHTPRALGGWPAGVSGPLQAAHGFVSETAINFLQAALPDESSEHRLMEVHV